MTVNGKWSRRVGHLLWENFQENLNSLILLIFPSVYAHE